MREIKYHRIVNPDSVSEILGTCPEGKILAGGQSLIPAMKQRLANPSDLLDIKHVIGLNHVTICKSKEHIDTDSRLNQTVTIGSVTNHSSVASHGHLAALCPAICKLAGQIGDPAVRNLGTIGGSIANNDPAADYPAAILALNAKINTQKRSINADDFFVGLYETALDDDEIIISVDFEPPELSGYIKFPNPASLYAMVGVFVSKFSSGTVRLAITGAGIDGVFRHLAMEKKLESNFSQSAVKHVSICADELLSDQHCDREYRAHLISVIASRAVEVAAKSRFA